MSWNTSGNSEATANGSAPSRQGRRRWLARCTAAAAWLAGVAAALPAWAAGRNREAFDAQTLDVGLIAAGVADAIETDQILLKAPDIAENSALVHIEIESKLPDTRSILLFAEKNPQPFVAQFDILPGTDPFVAVRIKMAESAFLRVVVLAGGKAYMIRRETKVTVGGCAG